MSIDKNDYTAKELESIYKFLFAFAANTTNQDTPTYREATTGKYAGEFDEAMHTEIEMLKRLNTWKVVRRKDVPRSKILKSTWAFKIKRLPSGKVRKFKARLCVRGDLQTFGVNYWETYAPVVSWTTVRLLTVLALVHDLHSKQVDYVNAYCQAPLQDHEELYMEPLRGYKIDCDEPCVENS